MENRRDAATATQRAATRCVTAFFDELSRLGVREAVVSPGSRSTALAMAAFELSRRRPDSFTMHVVIDERSAAFFALGAAKASGRPVALVCTSGTALANYYPAVLEAETSRVPLLVLSGDRPPHMQGLGAPQTCDQLKAYSDHVRWFAQMPLPEDSARAVAFARQAAREAVVHAAPGLAAGAGCAATGAGDGAVASRGCAWASGPVQVNFPFDEPLKLDLSVPDAFVCGRSPLADAAAPAKVAPARVLAAGELRDVAAVLRDRRVLVLAGEGTCETLDEAREVAAWAQRFGFPLVADPLSGLRSVDGPLIADRADNVFRREGCPLPEVVVRFGRWPVSKAATQRLSAARPIFAVVDACETRDFSCATDMFVGCAPIDFVRSMSAWAHAANERSGAKGAGAASGCALEAGRASDDDRDLAAAFPGKQQEEFAREFMHANDVERERVLSALPAADGCGQAGGAEPASEGAYVRALFEEAPEGSCVFSANSMAVRAIDTFYVKGGKRLAVLCNRGLNGIDGTVSTAVGAALSFDQTTFLTGDFTMQHDIGALALHGELLREAASRGVQAPSIVVVLLNNNGGGIFEMLPQRSDEPYFERLFSAPQNVDFASAARAFGVPYRLAGSVADFRSAYREFLGAPGISLIEVKLPLSGLKERYAKFQ